MRVPVYHPQIRVTLHKTVARQTFDGQAPVSVRYAAPPAAIDLTPFLGENGAVQTTKSVREAAGAFLVTLTDAPHRLLAGGAFETLYGLIEPMDVIEIRARHAPVGSGEDLTEPPIVMRGFVSDVHRTEAMAAAGRPQRTVTIAGQDYPGGGAGATGDRPAGPRRRRPEAHPLGCQRGELLLGGGAALGGGQRHPPAALRRAGRRPGDGAARPLPEHGAAPLRHPPDGDADRAGRRVGRQLHLRPAGGRAHAAQRLQRRLDPRAPPRPGGAEQGQRPARAWLHAGTRRLLRAAAARRPRGGLLRGGRPARLPRLPELHRDAEGGARHGLRGARPARRGPRVPLPRRADGHPGPYAR